MHSINSATLKKGVAAGHRTGQKVVKRVNNICTQLANSLSTPKCDTLRLLQKAEYDIHQLIQTRTNLGPRQHAILWKLSSATVAVCSCKAVLERKVGDLAQSLTSSLKGLESHMLNFEHVETELTLTIDVLNQTYFEARYGDYMFSTCSRIDVGKFSLLPCSTTDFMDPEELVKTGDFDGLSRRVVDDMTALDTDITKLPTEFRKDVECCAAIKKAVKAYRNRYFLSVNRITGSYQLSEYGERLRMEKERRDIEMAKEGMEDIDTAALYLEQPLDAYDILDDEIYISDGASRSATDGDKFTAVSDTASNSTSDIEGPDVYLLFDVC